MKIMLGCVDVNKAFGGVHVLRGVNLSVVEGEILGLIGPNGAGKTTLFNLIAGQLRCDTGQITLRDQSIAQKKPHEIARLGIGRTFQIVRPFLQMTCRENVRVGHLVNPGVRMGAKRSVDELLTIVNLHAKADLEAYHLNLLEKKRLEIARALSLQPQMLLLDEVMAGLNPQEIDQAVELILKLRRELGLTIVWVEHVMRAILKAADRVAVLHQGRVLRIGKPEVVVGDPEVVEIYLGKSKHAEY